MRNNDEVIADYFTVEDFWDTILLEFSSLKRAKKWLKRHKDDAMSYLRGYVNEVKESGFIERKLVYEEELA